MPTSKTNMKMGTTGYERQCHAAEIKDRRINRRRYLGRQKGLVVANSHKVYMPIVMKNTWHYHCARLIRFLNSI
jgi:hypothetical protein